MVDLVVQVNGRFLLLTQRASGVTLGGEVIPMFDPTESRYPDIQTTTALNALEDAAAALVSGEGTMHDVRESRRSVDAAIEAELSRRVAEAYAAGLAAQVAK